VAQGEQATASLVAPLIRYDFTVVPSTVTYFVQVQRGGVVKVGTSVQLAECYYALQIANPAPLEILGIVRHSDDAAAREHLASLQRRFRRWRIHGDWYRPAQGLLDHVAQSAEPVPLDTRPARRHEPSPKDVDAIADESSAELPLGLAKPDERLGVSIVTVRRWTRSGLLPHYQIGRAIIRYDLAEVIEAIGEATGTVGSPQPDDLTLQAVQVVAETLGVSQETVRRYTDLFLQALSRLEVPFEIEEAAFVDAEQPSDDSGLSLQPAAK
jgi:hypothetical protein